VTGREMVPWGTTIVGDVLSAFQIPGGGFVGKFGDKYLERKQKEPAKMRSRSLSRGAKSRSPAAECFLFFIFTLTQCSLVAGRDASIPVPPPG
jgi:hypothetical protein